MVLPYLAIASFVLGHIWRYRHDQFTWTTRSTQLLEARWLKIGSPLFHIGLLAVIGGHVIGILDPQGLDRRARDQRGHLPDLLGHDGHARRRRDARRAGDPDRPPDAQPPRRGDHPRLGRHRHGAARLHGAHRDVEHLVHNLIQGGYDYRETVSPWFRGLFLLDPDASLMTGAAVPLSYQLHAIGGWLLILIWPFTRLVHAWSVPVAYLRRPPIVYRSRAPRDVRAGAGGVAASAPSTESRVHVQS